MKIYFQVMINQVLVELNYKFNFLISIISSIIQLFMSIFVWQSIYKSNTTVGNYTLNEIIVYLVLASVISLLFSFDPIFRLGKMIHTGKLNDLLVKPINILGEYFSNYTGKKLINIILMVTVILIFKKSVSININVMVLIIVNYIMFFMLISFISTISFWIIQVWPLRPILNGLYMLLGGIYFPLDILPSKIYRVIKYNPFSIVGHFTSRAIQGEYTNFQIQEITLISILYIFLFYILYKILFKKGLKKYEGGQ